MSDRKPLKQKLRDLIREYEDGEAHNERAFDSDCAICLMLQDLRKLVADGQSRESP